MLDYSTWKQKKMSVPSLLLDPQNPRIPERKTPPTQAELIAELVAHDKVYELAKDISEVGFLPDAPLIAVMENGKAVVVEGNRRLTALKLLISPTLAPASEQSRFKRLAHKVTIPLIRTVKVEIAPSRDAAALVIQRRHTAKGIEPWSRAMQARFFVDRLNAGSTIAELAKEFSLPPSEIAGFVQSHQMYAIACALDFPPETAAKVRNPRDFPLSTLDRVYRNAKASSFLGITFNNGQVQGSIDVDEFKKGYAKIVSDIATSAEDSRSLNNDEAIEKYISKFGSEKPDTTKKGKFDATTITQAAAVKTGAAQKRTPAPPTAPKTPPSQKGVVGKAFPITSPDPRINDIIKELKALSVKDYPNAAATLLRTFVDLLVSRYADDVGVSKLVLAEHRSHPKSPKPKDWYPSARQLLQRVIEEGKILQLNPLALKAASKLVSDVSSPLSAAILDSYMHNRYVSPTESELRSFWGQLEEAFKEMLNPQPPAP